MLARPLSILRSCLNFLSAPQIFNLQSNIQFSNIQSQECRRVSQAFRLQCALPDGPAGLPSLDLEGCRAMLETIAIILLVLWFLGMVSGYTLGNFIYVLLVIAIV